MLMSICPFKFSMINRCKIYLFSQYDNNIKGKLHKTLHELPRVLTLPQEKF